MPEGRLSHANLGFVFVFVRIVCARISNVHLEHLLTFRTVPHYLLIVWNKKLELLLNRKGSKNNIDSNFYRIKRIYFEDMKIFSQATIKQREHPFRTLMITTYRADGAAYRKIYRQIIATQNTSYIIIILIYISYIS